MFLNIAKKLTVQIILLLVSRQNTTPEDDLKIPLFKVLSNIIVNSYGMNQLKENSLYRRLNDH